MGRDKRNEKRSEHFTKMIRNTMETLAWSALSTTAQAIYPFLKLEWRGPEANNNGRIRLSVRQAAAKIGVGINTAARGFQDLQAKGFIVVKTKGALGVDGEARGPSYELTELAMPGAERPVGRMLYKDWRLGEDHDVVTHSANNPEGRNGKNKTLSSKQRRSCHQNGDVSENPVTKMKTPCHQNSDVQPTKPRAAVIKMKTSLITIPRARKEVPNLSVMAGLDLCPLLAARRG